MRSVEGIQDGTPPRSDSGEVVDVAGFDAEPSKTEDGDGFGRWDVSISSPRDPWGQTLSPESARVLAHSLIVSATKADQWNRRIANLIPSDDAFRGGG